MNKAILAAVVACVCLTTPTTASADVPAPSVYLGLYGGGHLVLTDWDLNPSDTTSPLQLDHGGVLGLRLGVFPTWWLSIEGQVGFIFSESDQEELNTIALYGGDLLFHVMQGDWVPFIDVGVGNYAHLSGDLGPDNDVEFHYGIGLRGMLTDWLSLRIDVRHMMGDGFGKDLAHNLFLTAGLDFFVWRANVDSDGDGILDEDDACPETFGQASAKGCPDRDKDGVQDRFDSCPDTPGLKTLAGCPDRDGDGIADRDDKCPDIPGPAERQGCPDKDGDGVLDSVDKCPETPGLKALAGCPDTDGDGIADPQDRCPKVAGPRRTKGCPDRDGDGIADRDDKCPDTPGIPEEQGCLPKKVAEKFSGAMKGIYFATGSARIKKRSFKVLDEAVAILQQYKSVRVRIEGHTDDRGRDDKNLKLSQDRANSVRLYLIEAGINPDRMDAKGYGETKPIASNKTRKGRQQNRRIEFRIINN